MNETRVRFGVFELDLVSEELWRSGRRISLAPQPSRLLTELVRRQGQLVTHEDIRQLLWPEGIVREFEQGVHTAVRQVRTTLRDSATGSRYVETVPRRGYRFVAPVESIRCSQDSPQAAEGNDGTSKATRSSARRSFPRLMAASLAALGLGIVALGFSDWLGADPMGPASPRSVWTRGEDPRTFVAVLPFVNLSHQETDGPLAEGMTEELIACLGRVHPERLAVIARSSVMHLRQAPEDLIAVSRQLQVDYFLEGSVRVDAERVRVDARLIRAESGVSIWSDGYWRPRGDWYALHNEIAARVAAQLAPEALPPTREVTANLGSSDGTAYSLYLQGRTAWSRFDGEGLRESVTLYERAVQHDPQFSQAWGAMAESWALLAMQGKDARSDYAHAERCAQQALKISEAVPTAWNALGFLRLYRDWDWAGSDAAFRKAVSLDPGYAMAHHWYAAVLSAVERHDEAIAQVVAAMELDPRSLSVRSDLAWYYLYAGRLEEAEREVRRTLAVDPGYGWAKTALFQVHRLRGQHQLAANLGREFLAGGSDDRVLEIEGESAQHPLQRLFQHHLQDRLANNERDPFKMATALANAGRQEDAMPFLRQAIAERHVWATFARVDPRFRELRSHPDFYVALEQGGLGGETPPSLAREIER